MDENNKPKRTKSLKRFLLTIGIIIYLIALAGGLVFVSIKFILPGFKPISVETVKDSVVMIYTYDENNQQLGQGSGFCFQDSNTIITNFHVINGAKRIEILTDDGEKYEIFNILIFDKQNDLALIEGDFQLEPVVTISAYGLSADDKITTISSPAGAFNTISEGRVKEIYQDATEIEASIKPGSSGGAVLNEKGRVFAVIVATLKEGVNVNLAINIDVANSLYTKYENQKYAVIENNTEDIQSFLPDIFDDKDGNELTIIDNWTKNKLNVYQPESLLTFNNLTSSYSIFTKVMIEKNDGFSKIYADLSMDKKISVVDYYQYFKAFDQWWFSEDNIEFDATENLRKEKIKDWSNEQLLMDLGVLERYQLAILGAITEDLIYYDDFREVVKTLPISEDRKLILFLTLGGYKQKNLSNKQTTLVKNFINKSLEGDEKKINDVLKRIGI
ncbi:MAG: S1C family serine protease [Firmicutes bacterium]|nr:S1C family serine protease [Bacillota bacterium]